MHILGTPFEAVDVALLERLADQRVAESLTHDYKKGLPPKGKNDERTDLLAHLASFANAAGGILVVGFDEATWTLSGVAGWDDGMHVKQLDELSRRLVPALPRLRHRTLTRDGLAPLALVGVPRSLQAPHAVQEDIGWGFWARSNRGRYQMDLTEVRRAFLEAEQWERDADAFRRDRVQHVAANAGYLFDRSDATKKLYVHLLPLGRLRERIPWASDDYDALNKICDPLQLNQQVTNLDGIRKTRGRWVALTWIQFFRHGGIEACVDLASRGIAADERALDGHHIDELVYDTTATGLTWLAHLDVSPPYVLLLSVIGAKGTYIAPNRGSNYFDDLRFDRDPVWVPGITIDEAGSPTSAVVRPALDLLWQASGWALGTGSFQNDGSLSATRP